MKAPTDPVGQRFTTAAALLALFALLTAASLVRPPTDPGAFWPANGVLVVVMLLLSSRRQLAAAAIGAVLINFVLSMLVAGRPPADAIAGPLGNVGEAVLVAYLVRRCLGSDPNFGRLRVLAVFAFVCVIPATAAVCTTVSLAFADIHSWRITLTNIVGDSLGILMVVPALWPILRGQDIDLFDRRRLVWLVLFSALAGAETLLFTQKSLPALFLVFPFLIAISFRLGTVGAAYAVIVSGVVAFAASSAGYGPLAAFTTEWSSANLLLQAFVLAALYSALPAAGAIAEQIRLRQQLALREAEARAASEQAEQSAAEAIAAAAAKGEFLATMSHELRTPLISISGFSQLLLEQDDLSVETRRRLSLIGKASTALLTVVNDILDYSKIEAGKAELNLHPFNLATCVRAAVDMVREQASLKGVSLACHIPPEAEQWFEGDDDRIRQVLLNLLSNAVKFTREGGVDVTVDVGERAAGLPLVRVSVRDTGVGIPEDKLDTLFDRFTQADGSISRSFGGTGLGLAISKQLINLHGGEIGASSEVGQGSEFWFELPLPYAEVPQTVVSARIDTPLFARVLVVDDIDVNREIARIMLTAAGCEVAEADSARQAIEALGAEPFDVVLMDLQMPDVDGLSAMHEIRRMPAPACATPIIALTANVMEDDVRQYIAQGMDGHLGKPFKRDELIATVRKYSAGAQPPIGNGEAAGGEDGAAAPLFEPQKLASLGLEPGSTVWRNLLLSIEATMNDFLVLEQLEPWPAKDLRRRAHDLVGAAGSVGFTALSQTARRLQDASKVGDDELPAAAAVAFELARQSRAQLRQVLSEARRTAA